VRGTNSTSWRKPHGASLIRSKQPQGSSFIPIATYEKEGAVGVVTMATSPHNLIDEIFLDQLLSAYHAPSRADWVLRVS
jgi:hypothetical protein